MAGIDQQADNTISKTAQGTRSAPPKGKNRFRGLTNWRTHHDTGKNR